jgi:hypothetical protein
LKAKIKYLNKHASLFYRNIVEKEKGFITLIQVWSYKTFISLLVAARENRVFVAKIHFQCCLIFAGYPGACKWNGEL